LVPNSTAFWITTSPPPPANTVGAVVSDHGFEAAPLELNTTAFLSSKKLPLSGTISGAGYLTTFDPQVAAAFVPARSPETCIGCEIPRTEIDRFLPDSAPAARLFEPAPGCAFVQGKPNEPIISNNPPITAAMATGPPAIRHPSPSPAQESPPRQCRKWTSVTQ
jgi:hypothetical protein